MAQEESQALVLPPEHGKMAVVPCFGSYPWDKQKILVREKEASPVTKPPAQHSELTGLSHKVSRV